jgi:hypothetical protein
MRTAFRTTATPRASRFICDAGQTSVGGCNCMCADCSMNMGYHCKNRGRGCNAI